MRGEAGAVHLALQPAHVDEADLHRNAWQPEHPCDRRPVLAAEVSDQLARLRDRYADVALGMVNQARPGGPMFRRRDLNAF